MHQKKSEVQIGKESSGVSSDFNPTPPLLFPSSITQKHPSYNHNYDYDYQQQQQQHHHHQILHFQANPVPLGPKHDDSSSSLKYPLLSTAATARPHKRPLMNPTPSILESPTLPSSLHHYPFSPSRRLLVFSTAKSAAYRCIRRLRFHLRLLLLVALPFFYFLVSHPSHSFILDFLSAFAFSAALLFSLNLALPRLPSIRVFLNRSFPFPIKLSVPSPASRPLPVFWSIGSRSKPDKRATSGCWVQVYSNADVYEGEFHKGKCSGSGVYYYYMSGRYEGDWVDGKYDGYGVETWARGSRYQGQYSQGFRHGFGVYRFYTGDVYAGEWSNGQTHGCGIHTCDDASRYVGEFKWGVKHGLGHYHFKNGDTYAGEYFADKMHGFGVYKFGNGHRYEGAWHEGKRQGLGMYTFRNGETQAGHWHNGVLETPSTQNNATYPVSPVAVNHSKVLNGVQEARKAAEKAYDVAKVDERVNRAVAAANRAANAARVAAVKAVQKQMHHHHHHHHHQSNHDHLPMQIV